ncbi:hypothetical protein HanRHA438_Chr04g0156441 [Helianthus annuus]|nr:hypothetical protein HanRHA438_Chr04g0156441 [Helianthus annuus]
MCWCSSLVITVSIHSESGISQPSFLRYHKTTIPVFLHLLHYHLCMDIDKKKLFLAKAFLTKQISRNGNYPKSTTFLIT